MIARRIPTILPDLTFEEALELIDLGYICDVITILILEKAKKYFYN